MNLFKNYESKKMLREQIRTLENIVLMPLPPYYKTEKEIMKLACSLTTHIYNENEPMKYIKSEIAYKIGKKLEEFIQYEIVENEYGKKVTGSIEIVKPMEVEK